MLAAVASAAVVGIEAYHVLVEVDVAARGLPQWTIVGLPAGAVKESRERVSAALVNSGFEVPHRRITINLAPADTKKDGTAFDLPIALGLLVGTGQLRAGATDDIVALGELGLDGSLRPVRGMLPVARLLARSSDAPTLVLPPPNAPEAGLVSSLKLSAAPNLAALVDALRREDLPPPPSASCLTSEPDDAADMARILRGEAENRFPYAHDLAMQTALLTASGVEPELKKN